ncbi:MAG: ABC transporter permease [Polyangiales bacterium]
MSSKLRGATEEAAIQTIPPLHLVAAAIPALLVLLVLWWWRADVAQGFIALARMVAQLLLVGYVLVYIFEADTPWIVLSVLVVMVVTASWIALRTVPSVRGELYRHAFVSVLAGGGLTLALVTQGVLDLDPWYEPRFVVPLAGMIFAASMNSVSIAAERLLAELERDVSYGMRGGAHCGPDSSQSSTRCSPSASCRFPGS